MNAIRVTARWVFIISIPILLLSATLSWAFNSLWIYKAGFAKYGVSQALGVSPAQLDKSASQLIAYFNNPHQEYLNINVTYDTGETAPLFDQADILHMKDVKGLVWVDYRLLLAAAIYALVYIAASFVWNRRNGRHDLALGAEWGGGVTVGLLCFLGMFAVTSFNWFFTTFHEIFFPQGNWQFPPGDHMITLFPDGFWSDVTLLVGLVTLGLAVIVWAIGFLWLRGINKRELVPS
jgi:integral membrane protein (TIGR01906 family)